MSAPASVSRQLSAAIWLRPMQRTAVGLSVVAMVGSLPTVVEQPLATAGALGFAGALYLAASTWGSSIIHGIGSTESVVVAQQLPVTMSGVWQLMRDSISMMEVILDAIVNSDLPHWPTVLFLYLAVCLTVRMTPFEGNRRGAIAAILLSGVVIWIIAAMAGGVDTWILESWPLLSFTVGMLRIPNCAALLEKLRRLAASCSRR